MYLHDPAELAADATHTASFMEDAVAGLSIHPKTLPCKYFYDARGSRLFDAITELDAYYPTRTELGIMEHHIDEMVDRMGPRVLLVEYGSGSSLKTRILLEHLRDPAGYVPIDISTDHLYASARRLEAMFPQIEIRPVNADYTSEFDLPTESFDAQRVVVYFPGSTIGNFKPASARRFLEQMARVAGPGGGLLIGVDLDKDPAILEAAYNDEEGVTAEFNLNLLRRMNDELGADFDLDAFEHEAVYNPDEGRVEMYLISRRRQAVRLGGRLIRFEEGERIHTENSYKYTLPQFEELASGAGFDVREVWTDDEALFSVQYLETGD